MGTMKVILGVGFLVFHMFIFPVKAQLDQSVQNQYKFKHLTIDQGLSNNFIMAICQDSKGFIWFATQNGLNKFDGQTIVTYWYDINDSTSISSNLINSLYLDSKNNLWVGGAGGLDLYDPEYDKFIRFSHKDLDWPIEQVYSIAEDKNGKLWFGGISGLYTYDLNTSEFQYFNNKEGNSHGIPPNLIYKILVDRNNKVWISVLYEGLYVIDQSHSTYQIFSNNPSDKSSISGNRVEKIYEDSKGKIWVCTFNNGLNLFDPGKNSFKRFTIDPDNNYSTRVRTIFEDMKGNMFVGTRAGLYLRNGITNKFIYYAYEGHNFSDLSQNSITESYIDKKGFLWIGTFAGGINYTNLNRKEFAHYTAGKDDIHFLSGANVYAITEDQKGNLWIGGDNGLNYLDRTTSTFKYFKNDPNDPFSLSYNDVKSLEWDSKGNLWIGTNRGGLNYYNIKTGRFTSFRHDPNNPNSIAGDKVYCLMTDKNNNLWIIASPNNRFTPLIDILPDGQKNFIHLEPSHFGFDQNENGDVFIGGHNGFWIFNRKDSTYNFISKPEIIGNVNTIKIDSHDRLWIGSTKGLTRYDMTDNSFKSYSVQTGYDVGEVYGILEDESSNLWLSTNSGLLKIINIVDDTTNVKIRVYDHYDGIQSKQFNYNAFYKCRSGEMMFGGVNGFNTFYPEKIVENKEPANIVLTNLKIFNIPVPIGEKVDGDIILEKSISVTDEIVLGPKQNIFTIEFASFQSSNPDRYAYKTKLAGLDKDWQYRKAGNNQVTYTNLNPGDYTFLLSAANSDGFWNENPVTLNIKVIPPIWKTWWFRIITFLLFIGIVFVIYFYRVRSIRQQNLTLEKTVKNRTKEISQKNNMLLEANNLLKEKQEEIFAQKEELEAHRSNLELLVEDRTHELEKALERAKESDALKSAFLANMSHEIRTPMNAITGFSSLLIDAGIDQEERKHFVQIIKSNSDSLLKIIDEILDLSLIESNQLKIINEEFELNVILDHLFSYYTLDNKTSDIEIRKNNTLEDQSLTLFTDSVRIKQILTNLMDNALKFTGKGYIELGVYEKNNDLCFYVKDTGKGIPSKDIDNVFQQFIKIEDDEAGWIQGLGLGLAISQKTANALGGNILVESVEGKGSTFTFSIPLKNIVTENKIIASDKKEIVPVSWQGKTILIAEDVVENFLFLKNALGKTHANILWAKNGEEAIKIFHDSSKIDVILMDIKMPVINGYDAAKKIKEDKPDQIIVAQTAYARPQEKFKFYDENFDDYISKPIDRFELFRILQKFI